MKGNSFIFIIIFAVGALVLLLGQKKKEFFDTSTTPTNPGFSAGEYLILPYASSINRQTPLQPILSKINLDIIRAYNLRATDLNIKSKLTFLFTMYVYIRNILDSTNDNYIDLSSEAKMALRSENIGINSPFLN